MLAKLMLLSQGREIKFLFLFSSNLFKLTLSCYGTLPIYASPGGDTWPYHAGGDVAGADCPATDTILHSAGVQVRF